MQSGLGMDNKLKENQVVEGSSSGITGEQDALGRQYVAGQKESGAQAPRAELLESLSAMMDDEAESLETRRIVKALEHSAESSPELPHELLSHWRRYHAVRASLQHEIHTTPSVDLLSAVKARLADEAAFNSSGIFRKSLRTGRIFRIGGQGLIAATVAAAVLVGYPMLNVAHNGAIPGGASPALVADQSVADKQIPARDTLPQMNGDYSASPLTRTVSLDDAARRRLETAVRNFSGTTAVLNSSNSAMFVNQLEPFAANSPAVPPVVSPVTEQPAQRR
jgi:negative regulator of sigma E activity